MKPTKPDTVPSAAWESRSALRAAMGAVIKGYLLAVGTRNNAPIAVNASSLFTDQNSKEHPPWLQQLVLEGLEHVIAEGSIEFLPVGSRLLNLAIRLKQEPSK